MPYRKRNEPCTQKDGESGNSSIDKKAPDGSWKQVQCFESREERDRVLAMLRRAKE